jgi:hypothetical protein
VELVLRGVFDLIRVRNADVEYQGNARQAFIAASNKASSASEARAYCIGVRSTYLKRPLWSSRNPAHLGAGLAHSHVE